MSRLIHSTLLLSLLAATSCSESSDATNVEDAHLFLNYMMRPEVGAADSNFTWYATANKTGKDMVDEEVTTSPAAFPTS